MLFIILALTGIFVGLLSAFFGVGGGVIIVPILYWMFPDVHPSSVIGTSLTVIFLNSVLNSYNFKKLKLNTQWTWGALLAVGMVIGILTTSQFVTAIEPRKVRLFFGIVLFLTALRTLFFKPPEDTPEEKPPLTGTIAAKLAVTGIGGGAIAGLTGLGGGIVMVPLLMTFLKIPLRLVPIYSNMAMAGGTLVGMIRYSQVQGNQMVHEGILASFQLGSVQFAVALLIFIGATFSSRFGARLTQRVDRELSKRLFIALLVIMGSRILYSSLT